MEDVQALGTLPSLANGNLATSGRDAMYPSLWDGLRAAWPWHAVGGPAATNYQFIHSPLGQHLLGTFAASTTFPSWTMTRFGWAITWPDGTVPQARVEVPMADSADDFPLLNTAPVAMSLWWRPRDIVTSFALLSIADAGSTSQYVTLIQTNLSKLDWSIRSGGSLHVITTNSVISGAWNHGVVQSSSSSDHRAVLNGDFANEGTSGTTLMSTGWNRIVIGSTADSSKSAYAQDMDMLSPHVWNRTLTEREISLLANDPVALWRLHRRKIQFVVPAAPGGGTPMHYYRRRHGLWLPKRGKSVA